MPLDPPYPTHDLENLTLIEREELASIPVVAAAVDALAAPQSEAQAAERLSALAALISKFGKGMLGNS